MAPQRRSTASSTRKHSKASSSNTSRSSTGSSLANKPTASPLQDLLLSIFSQSFPHALALGSQDLQSRIQRLKQRLYARDFAAAFGDASDLEAYTLRWSPPRALAYQELMCSGELRYYIREALLGGSKVSWGRSRKEGVQGVTEDLDHVAIEEGANAATIAAFGAGPGAELVAFYGALVALREKGNEDEDEDEGEDEDQDKDETLESRKEPTQLRIVDFGPWKPVLSALESTLEASAAETLGWTSDESSSVPSTPLSNNLPTVDFTQRDILDLTRDELVRIVRGSRLVTFLFTLNELYESSKGKTTALLLGITDLLQPGALLLVVDSPGSYATVDVGAGLKPPRESQSVQTGNDTHRHIDEQGREDKSKAYPMHWLLDHTLLEAASVWSEEDETEPRGGKGKRRRRWKKVYEERSRWFRLPKDIKYPLALEDMRYQAHCYLRV